MTEWERKDDTSGILTLTVALPGNSTVKELQAVVQSCDETLHGSRVLPYVSALEAVRWVAD